MDAIVRGPTWNGESVVPLEAPAFRKRRTKSVYPVESCSEVTNKNKSNWNHPPALKSVQKYMGWINYYTPQRKRKQHR